MTTLPMAQVGLWAKGSKTLHKVGKMLTGQKLCCFANCL